MKRIIKIGLMAIATLLVISLVFLFTHVPPVPKEQGVVQSRLYLGEKQNQPLVVAFGGGGGGNDWERTYLKEKRDSFTDMGCAVLAVGYFNYHDTPKNLDRISLNAIRDSIMSVAKNPMIDESRIFLLGGSKGGELVLNLASRYDEFAGVIAMSTSHVSFPALTPYSNTSSWSDQGVELPYAPAPLKVIGPALKGDLFTAHTMMLEDEVAAQKAEIPVENIEAPILILSGSDDDQWPASMMSEKVISRLKANDFKYEYQHIELEGGHVEPLNHFDLVYKFIQKHIAVE